MQLVQITDKLKPLALAVGLFSTPSAFAYSDIDFHSGILTNITNNKTAEHIKIVDNNDYRVWAHQFKFQTHLFNWENKTKFLSSTKSIIEDSDFKSIISMGENIVPLIIQEIERNPSTLVWALNFIYGKKITENPTTTIPDACKLWVKELKK